MHRFRVLALLTPLAAIAGIATAQPTSRCDIQTTAVPFPGVYPNRVNVLKWWDPDGPGPRPTLPLLGGSFAAAGDQATGSVCCYDPVAVAIVNATPGLGGEVTALAPMPDGALIAAGQLVLPGGASAFVAKWEGGTWHNLTNGLSARPRAIALFPDGDVVAGGFDYPLPSGYTSVMRRTPAGWVPVGGSIGQASLLAVTPDGALFAAGGVHINSTRCVGRWTGSEWVSLVDLPSFGLNYDGLAFTLETSPDGSLLIGGHFGPVGPNSAALMRYSGGVLTSLPSIPNQHGASTLVYNASAAPDGSVLAFGTFDAGAGYAPVSGVYHEGAWRSAPLRGDPGAVLAMSADSFIYAGDFAALANQRALGFFHYDAGPVPSVGAGPSGPVYAALPAGDPAGLEYYGAGEIGGGGVPNVGLVAIVRDNRWLPLRYGLDGTRVHCIERLPDGRIAFGGDFSGPSDSPRGGGSLATGSFAVWNGSSWESTGPIIGRVFAAHLLESGDLMIGGWIISANSVRVSGVAVRSGTSWRAAPGLSSSAVVYALAQQPGGPVLAAGAQLFGTSTVAQWNGATWSSLNFPGGTSYAILPLPSGDIVLGGVQQGTSHFAVRRAGSTQWTNLGGALNGTVYCLEPLPRPDGGTDVLVGGTFTVAAGVPVNRIARWVPESNQWYPVGPGANGAVRVIRCLPSGRVVVGGDFTEFNGQPTAFAATVDLPKLADLNCDAAVDGDDVIQFFEWWDRRDPEADFDADGDLDPHDLASFMAMWNAGF